MSFPARLLRPGERVVLEVRPHGWSLVPPVLVSVGVLAGAVAAGVAGVPRPAAWAVVAVLAVVLGWLVGRYLRWVSTSFVLTTDRLVHRRGILGRRSREIPLEQLSDISYHQSFVERLLRIGDLLLESAGRDSLEVFTGLAHPEVVQREIHDQLEQGRARRRSGDASIPQQIEQLAELARRGVLSPAEFEAKKAELLGRL